jgi:Kef-type K+ transport system membrane component KefB
VRVLVGVIVAMALVIGIVPQFTNCEARGGTMSGTTASSVGSTTTMKCFWTARAEIGVALPLFVIGALMLFSRRKETRRALAVPAAALGVVAMLLPTALIGVCTSPGAICRTALLPFMLIAGGLTVAASLALLIVNELRLDTTAQRQAAG